MMQNEERTKVTTTTPFQEPKDLTAICKAKDAVVVANANSTMEENDTSCDSNDFLPFPSDSMTSTFSDEEEPDCETILSDTSCSNVDMEHEVPLQNDCVMEATGHDATTADMNDNSNTSPTTSPSIQQDETRKRSRKQHTNTCNKKKLKTPIRLGSIWAASHDSSKLQMSVKYQHQQNYIGTFDSLSEAERAQRAAHASLVAFDRASCCKWTNEIRQEAVSKAKEAALLAISNQDENEKMGALVDTADILDNKPSKPKNGTIPAPRVVPCNILHVDKGGSFTVRVRYCKDRIYIGRFASRNNANCAQAGAINALAACKHKLTREEAIQVAKEAANKAVGTIKTNDRVSTLGGTTKPHHDGVIASSPIVARSSIWVNHDSRQETVSACVRYQKERVYIGRFYSRKDAEQAQTAAIHALMASNNILTRQEAMQVAKEAANKIVGIKTKVARKQAPKKRTFTPRLHPPQEATGSISMVGDRFQMYVRHQGDPIYIGRFDSREHAKLAQVAAHDCLVSLLDSSALVERQRAIAMAKQAAHDAVSNENGTMQQPTNLTDTSTAMEPNVVLSASCPVPGYIGWNGTSFSTSIQHQGKKTYIGSFHSRQEAICAQKAAHECLVSFQESLPQKGLTQAEQKEAIHFAKQAARDAIENMNPSQQLDQHSRRNAAGASPQDDLDTCSTSNTHGERAATQQSKLLESKKEIGSRAYCRWDSNDQWYWGTITGKKIRKNGLVEHCYYSVQFDDGDVLEEIKPCDVWTVKLYRQIFEEEPPPPPVEYRHLTQAPQHTAIDVKTGDNQGKPCAAPAATAVLEQDNNDLVGKRTFQEWTNAKGGNEFLYGVVAGVDSIHEKPVTVHYGDGANASCQVKSRKLSLQLALGAISSFQRKNSRPQIGRAPPIKQSPPCWIWCTPEWRTNEMVNAGCGLELPRLVLDVRGFRLTFSVKPSTTGYGVFVKCNDMVGCIDGNERSIKLQQGELVDLGVVAPLRKQDKKKKHVMMVKKYIHSFKCQEWCFQSEDENYEFDVSDDFTGKAHELAQGSIASYMNECNSNHVATVQTDFDPEGNLHCLLGVVEEGGTLTLAGGVETELFIKHRDCNGFRKGFSHPSGDKSRVGMLPQDDKDCLDEIGEFAVDKVRDCTDFFQDMFQKQNGSNFSPVEALDMQVGQRALVVCRHLEQRARALGESQQVGDAATSLAVPAAKLVSTLEGCFGDLHGGVENVGPDSVQSS